MFFQNRKLMKTVAVGVSLIMVIVMFAGVIAAALL